MIREQGTAGSIGETDKLFLQIMDLISYKIFRIPRRSITPFYIALVTFPSIKFGVDRWHFRKRLIYM